MNRQARKFWSLVLIAAMLSTGCQPQQPFYCREDGDLSHYLDVATEIDYPDVCEPSLDEVTNAHAPLTVKNTDATLHNVHALATVNQEFNQAQPQGLPPFDKTFDKQEMVKVKCDVHPWMASYVGVVPHPYYAVSGEDGSYSIANLPAGTYTLEAWHEKFGTVEAKVTVGAGETKNVEFTFKPTS